MSKTPTPGAIAGAQSAEAKWGIPASITLAQWALESDWGNDMPPGSNNPFGIKALKGEPSVTVETREVDKYGRSYDIDAPFAAFASIAEAFDAHGKLLATMPAYAPARKHLPDPVGFANALTGVYATDPRYGASLCALMTADGFYAYNKQQHSASAPAAAPVSHAASRPAPAVARPVVARPSEDDSAETDALNEASLEGRIPT